MYRSCIINLEALTVMIMEGCPVMYQNNEFTLKRESAHKELKDSLEPKGCLNTLILPFSY